MTIKSKSYEFFFKRECDFTVKYELIIDQDDYFVSLYQGIKTDFCYVEDDLSGPIYMIWPEFELSSSTYIENGCKSVPDSGVARMWIALNEQRNLHRNRLKNGVKGYMVFGGHKVAKIEVIEVRSLLNVE